MNSGHGWTSRNPTNGDPAYWDLQRGIALNSMNEDYGNLDQLNFFAAYCFNAGAVVASMRPLGQQTNEVVLDNDDAGVTFAGTGSAAQRAASNTSSSGHSVAASSRGLASPPTNRPGMLLMRL